jgi:two-component system, LytTR family, sensor kinase
MNRAGTIRALWWMAGSVSAALGLTVAMSQLAEAAGVDVRWTDLLTDASLYVLSWLVVLPLLLWVTRRLPLDARGTAWRLPVAIVARPLLALLATPVQLMLHFLLVASGIGGTPAMNAWEESGGMFFVGRFYEGVVFALLVMIADTLLARQRAEHARQLQAARLESQLAEARLSALSMELQPHFLFNTLNAISSLVHSDPMGADRMIARLSTLLRRTLEAGQRPLATLDEELMLLSLYLDIQRVRFGDRLTVAIDVADDVRDAEVPRLLLQPLVENAMQHGLAPKPGPVRLDVRARRNGDTLELEIGDDGVGLGSSVSEGTGLTNTRSRLAQLYPGRHTLDIRRGAGGGAHVGIAMPLVER